MVRSPPELRPDDAPENRELELDIRDEGEPSDERREVSVETCPIDEGLC